MFWLIDYNEAIILKYRIKYFLQMALGEASWATFMGQVGHGLRLAMAQLAPSKKNTNRKKKQLSWEGDINPFSLVYLVIGN